MSTTEQNRAAWLMEKQAHPFKVDDAPMPNPGKRGVVIRSHACAINPVDAGIQAMGILWTEYPCVLGCDIAGEVVSVGTEVKRFKKGDRVFGGCEDGGFSLYPMMDESIVAKLPDNVSYKQGCVLPLAVCTAAVSIFHPSNLGLEPPQLEPKKNGKVVLVWGASSSVGACGVQMIKAAGYEVAATASGHNEQFCKDIGVDYFFDHKKENVADSIASTLKDKPFAGVFSAIMTPEVIHTCASLASKLGTDPASKVVATVMPESMPFTESLPEGVRLAYCNSTVEIVPETKLGSMFGWERKPNFVGPDVWEKWISKALEKGQMKCKPDPEVVGKGLEGFQGAVDLMGKGVSAKKLVVEL